MIIYFASTRVILRIEGNITCSRFNPLTAGAAYIQIFIFY